MQISKQELLKEAHISKFRPEILEKVWWLLKILEEISHHPFLQQRVALKGGTALNLFYFNVPRLSVDIDLNYIGSVERSTMLLERPMTEKALETVFSKVGLSTVRIPQKHAGGKWQLKYPSSLGSQGNLEVDLNFMFRLPILTPTKKNSRIVGGKLANDVLLMSYEEIAAGKLTALFARNASRDLFDTYYLLMDESLNLAQLRLIFCVYGAMSSIDWREISLSQIALEDDDLSKKLVPVLRVDLYKEWVSNAPVFIKICQKKLENFFPFSTSEQRFFDLLYNEGKIDASILTTDPILIEKIQNQPLLKWKTQLVLQNQSTP